jgi:hypothetical protein
MKCLYFTLPSIVIRPSQSPVFLSRAYQMLKSSGHMFMYNMERLISTAEHSTLLLSNNLCLNAIQG